MERNRVCPWQARSLLTCTLRKMVHNPRRITEPYLSKGMTAMDVGCGVGFFTVPMADIVGEQGKVIAIDLQPEMLDGLKENAYKAGMENITAHPCGVNSLRAEQWNGTIDFVLVFMMLHEVPDPERLIREIHAALAPKGKLLFAEPVGHVGRQKFQQSLNMIKNSGFTVIETPRVAICRAAVLQKA